MTRRERVSRMVGSRNSKSGIKIKNSRLKRHRILITRRQILLIIVTLFLFMGSGIGHVWSSFEMTQIGYDISELKNKEMSLMEANRKLRLELAHLKSPRNLAALAKKLGLSQPSPEQIIVLP